MTSDHSDTPAAIAKRSAPEPLKTALHAHLRSIVDKPISTRMLLELGQAASLASQLLVVSGENRALAMGRNQGVYIGGGNFGGDVIGPADLDAITINPTPPGGGGFGGVLAPAAFGAPENFGAETIRNMVADMQKPKLSDLMRSLEDAEHLLSSAETDDSKAYYGKIVKKIRAQVDEAVGGDDEGQIEGEPPCLDCMANLSEHGRTCGKHEGGPTNLPPFTVASMVTP